MVNVCTFIAAMLASSGVTSFRFSLLCSPIRAAVIRFAAPVLRVIFSYAVFIAAIAGTVFSFSAKAFRLIESDTATETGDGLSFFKSFCDSYILAFRRTVFTAPMFQSGRYNRKLFAAIYAVNLNHKNTIGAI